MVGLKDYVARKKEEYKVAKANVEFRRKVAQSRAWHKREEERKSLAERGERARKELAELKQEDKDRATVAELRRERFARTKTGRLASGLSSFASEATKGMSSSMAPTKSKPQVPKRGRRKAAPKRRKGSRRKVTRRRRSRRVAPKRREVRNLGDIFGGI